MISSLNRTLNDKNEVEIERERESDSEWMWKGWKVEWQRRMKRKPKNQRDEMCEMALKLDLTNVLNKKTKKKIKF